MLLVPFRVNRMKPLKKPLNHQSKLRIFAANNCKNIIDQIDTKLLQFNSKNVNVSITCVHSVQQLTQDEFNWISNLTEANMKEYYEKSENGWNRKQKEKEFRHQTARFLLCRLNNKYDTDDEETSHTTNGSEKLGDLVAFVHFRFELDYLDKHPILYCYEIQVANEYQCYGLGRHLMLLLEQIASKFHMKNILLTCFKHNPRSLNFYQKLGYTIDSCSPSKCGQEASYEILCHKVNN